MKLGEIAAAIGSTLRGDGEVQIHGAASLEDAEPGTLSFLADRRHAAKLATTRASALILAPDAPDVAMPSLRAPHPYVAFVAAVELLHPPRRPVAGIHSTAVIAPSATIAPGAFVGPHVVVGERVRIGRDAVLHARVTIYDDVEAGDEFTAHAGAVVREGSRLGDRVTLHAGAVVGSDGFGYLPLPDGNRKIPQIGTVVLEDDVEVGANTTIDRGALGATVVGRGTKIDNLVMIAHNCRLGPHCLLAGQVGLAGGTILGARVLLGGQVGSAGHLTIGDGARLVAQSGVHADIPAGETQGGCPSIEVGRWRRAVAGFSRLPEILRRLRRLERAAGLPRGDDGD